MNNFIAYISKRWNSIGLNKRLLYSYVLLFSIILIFCFSVLFFTLSRYFNERIISSNSETIDQAAMNIQQYMEDVESLLFNISTNHVIQSYLSSSVDKSNYTGVIEAGEITNEVLNIDAFSKKTTGVYIFAQKQPAYPIYSASRLNLSSGQTNIYNVFRSVDVIETQWYINATAAHGKVVWNSEEYDLVRDKSEYTANRMIFNTKNLKESLGVIRVFISPDKFQNILNAISLGSSGEVYLYSNKDLLHYPDNGTEKELLAQLENTKPGTVEIEIDGNEYYVIAHEIKTASWMLVGLIPKSAVSQQYSILRNVSLAALFFAIIVTVVMSRFVSDSISRPIREVASAMENYKNNSNLRFDESRQNEVGVLFSSYNRMMDDFEYLLTEVQQRLVDQRHAELQALQAQINPHFLYNTLDCITSIAYSRNNLEIVELTVALSDFFRISLNKGCEYLPLQKELEHIISYCSIQKYRINNSFSLHIEVPETLQQIRIIKLILQPLVENSIIHGFGAINYPGVILIRACYDDPYLKISVIDNGEGCDVEYLNDLLSGEYKAVSNDSMFKSGYGINNVNERIHLAYGKDSKLYYSENDDAIGISANILLYYEGAI